MELKHLKSFVSVASQLSFVRAANQLHISQPSLSGQVQKLEEELGAGNSSPLVNHFVSVARNLCKKI
ncbi:LysR family transcriptional regulator [Alloacidobacterium dinghuense]|uniref:LysR family transcriptional regulator n=1 Tax=Alloacidobacterium dinghuense TaxID=2763107 RepID=A0A7G8BCA5_9BACT|nr:LysR family transcriptional regulator [Alloacidobacterium dinghuense]QNI30175.1 LysR family transcriptional regulator [Alloacidobacterium dinghuense]